MTFTFPEADPPATPIRSGFGGVLFINSLLTGTKSETDAIFKRKRWPTDSVRDGRERDFTFDDCVTTGALVWQGCDITTQQNSNMAASGVFFRKTLTSLLYRSYNQLRINYLNYFRCLSLAPNTKGSKPGSSKGKNIYDVAIVGGGVMGSSSAYFLANRMTPEMGKICVIERDPTVRTSN